MRLLRLLFGFHPSLTPCMSLKISHGFSCNTTKSVTIFFSDIVGFTTMCGEMRPVQVMRMLNELYMELDKLVAKHKIYKVETIG